ncbi:MAG: hypothetical protein LBS09_05795 [Bacteroidales bacterium]|jgi:ABC-type phosphate transport system substrate-binding protein|nr:hypothetical protein [Bacteroidales bacterium]
MKSNFLKSIRFAILASAWTTAYTFGGDNDRTISISTNGSKFITPILEKWVDEYRKEHPEVQFNIGDQVENGTLSVIVSGTDDITQKVIFAGKYALLPVSNPKNPFFRKGKGLSKKDLKNILFEKSILDAEDDYGKDRYKVNVYSRTGKNGGTPVILANFFESTPKQIKGKKLFGDEIYILNAIRRDSVGFAYTSLNYLYDLQTRALNPDLSLVPLSIKSKQKEKLYSSDIDQVITLLENEEVELIPVENFGFVFSERNNTDAIVFVEWILEKGQQYNHELGFLQLDGQALVAQEKQLRNEVLLSAK